MATSKIDFTHTKVGRMADASDLAEMLFPGNRGHQHAFLVIWLTLKWQADNMVPNLAEVTRKNGITRRTYERVRAKMRRTGLIDRVSRFNAGYGHREGWVLSTRFERGLRQLANRVDDLKDPSLSNKEKDFLLITLARARRDVTKRSASAVPLKPISGGEPEWNRNPNDERTNG